MGGHLENAAELLFGTRNVMDKRKLSNSFLFIAFIKQEGGS